MAFQPVILPKILLMRVLFLLMAMLFAGIAFGQPVTARPIAYQVPAMKKVVVKENIKYRTINDTSLTLDIYYPPGYDGKKPLPVVVFNNGVGSMELPKWRVYQDWARLIAANGMVAVNHQGRPNRSAVMDDCGAVFDYLRQHAKEINIDPDRIGVWTCSGNSRAGIALSLKPGRPYIRTLVVYYGGPDSLGQMRQDVPTLVVRAGLDAQGLNMGIENFVQAALVQDARIEMINYLDGIHAFDIYDHSDESKAIIKRTVDFLKQHLDKPVANRGLVLTNRNFMWMMNNGQSKAALAAFRKTVVQYRADSTFHPFYNGVIREDILNTNSYWLLRNGKQAEALETFKLMVETYPNSANAYDGLADAYDALGNKAEAIANSEKSLELLQKDTTTNEQTKAAIRRSAEDKLKRLKG
jgi:tetratricopeptide (TPR) repeat protein